MKRKSLSLKYKLLILMVTLPLVSLSAYLVLATDLFKTDKIAYVFDSNATAVRSTASRVQVELNSIIRDLQGLIQEFDESSKNKKSTLETQFARRGTLAALKIYRMPLDARHAPQIFRDNELPASIPIEDATSDAELLAKASPSGLLIRRVPNTSDWIEFIQVYTVAATGHTYGAISWASLGSLHKVFQKVSTFSAFLIDSRGDILFGPDEKEPRAEKVKTFSDWKFFKDLDLKNAPQGVAETSAPNNRKALLAAYSSVGFGSLVAITLLPKQDALRAVDVLLYKSLVFFFALLSLSVVVSVFASHRLTSALAMLYTATRKVSEGDFTVQVEVKSNDEIGALADSFNRMAGEVSRLISETADKARMEKELETAKHVQETLFPEPKYTNGPIELAGFYTPASECGGDWWYYKQIGTKVFVWVGDATGHGAPAALITSAARSAASVVESMVEYVPQLSPATAMRMMNRAIFETSKGKMNMTFFIASIDLESGEVVYSNASHDPPFLLHQTGQALKKSDLLPLDEVNNPRLGEKEDFEFAETRFQLVPGDTIMFYTDGVSDVRDPGGTAWGTKTFLKTLLAAVSTDASAEAMAQGMQTQIESFRQNSTLPDDVTLFVVRYKAAHTAVSAAA